MESVARFTAVREGAIYRSATGYQGYYALFVYNHRRPPVGVKAQLMRLDGERWVTLFDDMVWSPENKAAGTISKDNYAVTSFQFGLPSALRVDDRQVMVVYWCVIGGRAGINYTVLALER